MPLKVTWSNPCRRGIGALNAIFHRNFEVVHWSINPTIGDIGSENGDGQPESKIIGFEKNEFVIGWSLTL